MNAGLTNLDTLKKHLLAGTMGGQTQFDLQIKTIGIGVASLFEQETNRRLAWLDDDQQVFQANRPFYYLPRFPIAKITAIQMRYFVTDNRADILAQPVSVNHETGLVHFGYTLGKEPLQVRVTWSGGYWFETLEPEDEAYPSPALPVLPADPNIPPARAYLLPDALQSAFLLQCQHMWDVRDQLGLSLVDRPGEQTSVGKMEMSPMVRQMLQPFIRYQLS